jgi:hypothetical protein
MTVDRALEWANAKGPIFAHETRQTALETLAAEVERLQKELFDMERRLFNALIDTRLDVMTRKAETSEAEVIHWQQANKEQLSLLVKVEGERDRYREALEAKP